MSLDLLTETRDNRENLSALKIYPQIQWGIRQREAKQLSKEQLFKQRLQPLMQLCLQEYRYFASDPKEKRREQVFSQHRNSVFYYLNELVEHLEGTESIAMEVAIFTLKFYFLRDVSDPNTFYEILCKQGLLSDVKSVQRAVIQRKELNFIFSGAREDWVQDFYIRSLSDKEEMKLSAASINKEAEKKQDKERSDIIIDPEKFFRKQLSQLEISTLAKQLKEAVDFDVQCAYYYQFIEESKTNESKAIAAANAITLLNAAGENFANKDFQGVRIPGANLSGALLPQVKFTGADLRQVCLQNSWAVGADFREAKMEGVTFNEEIGFDMHKDSPISWDVSPDGKTLAVVAWGEKNRIIKLFDTTTRRLQFWFGEEAFINGVTIAWDKKGNRLAVGYCDGPIVIWEASSGKLLQELKGHQQSVHCLSWHPHSEFIASASEDTTVRVWDLERGIPLWEFKEHKQEVTAVAWDPTGKQLASAGKDRHVFIIQERNGKILQSYSCESEIYSLIWEPSGQNLVVGGDTIQIFDIEKQKKLPCFEGSGYHDYKQFYKQLVWIASRNLLVACTNNSVQVWNPVERQLQSQITNWRDMGSMAYWPGEEKVIVGGQYSDHHYLDVVQCRSVSLMESSDSLAGMHGIHFIVSDPSGKRFAFVGVFNTILVIDSQTLKDFGFSGHSLGVTALAWDPQGKRLASAGDDYTIRLWDIENQKELAWLTGHTSSIRSLSWNPRGDRLVCVTYSDEVWLWDVNTQQCYAQLAKEIIEYIHQVVWDGSGTRLIGCNGHNLNKDKFWIIDVATGKLLAKFGKLLQDIFSVHPREEQITAVSGYGKQDIQVLNFKGESLGKISKAHQTEITSLQWDREGKRLVSGDHIGLVKIWQISDGKCLLTLTLPREVTCLHWLVGTEGPLLIVAYLYKLAAYTLTQDYKSAKLQWKLGKDPVFIKEANFTSATGLSSEDKNLLTQKGAMGLLPLVCQPMQLAEKQFFLGEYQHLADPDYLLGISYRRGFGVVIDEKRAAHHFQIAAQKGHVRAKSYFASYCQEGIYTLKDEKLAQHYYQEFFIAISQQIGTKPDAWSYYILALNYESGSGVEKDEKQAQIHYQLAFPLLQIQARKGSLQAQTWLGALYEYGLGGVDENTGEAVRWYNLAAAEEFAYAQTSIGNYYERQIDSFDRAIYWYQRAAEKGDEFAISRLKLLSEISSWSEVDKNEVVDDQLSLPDQSLLIPPKNSYLRSSWYRAFVEALRKIQLSSSLPSLFLKLLRDSAEAGIPQALTMVALCYEEGLGTEKDQDKAMKYYELALGKKDAYAQLYFANRYQTMAELPDNKLKSLEYYRLAAQQGEMDAQVKLGMSLIDELKPDFAEAFFWFDSAAQQGDGLAQLHTGLCYEYGLGVEADDEAAFNYYQLAEKNENFRKTFFDYQPYGKYEHAVALTILGFSYERGIGVELNNETAMACYRRAAQNDYWVAITRLNDKGEEYKFDPNNVWLKTESTSLLLWAVLGDIIFGLSPQKILPERFAYIREGMSNMLCLLAMRCWNQKRWNQTISSYWFRLSALLGNSFAQAELGLRYELGEGGLLKDIKQAVHWYQLSVEQGDARGQYYLADCYERGCGVIKDSRQALLLYKKAAVQGHEEAKKELNKIRKLIAQPLVISSLVTQALLDGRDPEKVIRQAMAINEQDDLHDPSIAIALSSVQVSKGLMTTLSSTPHVSTHESKLSISQPEKQFSTPLQNVVTDDERITDTASLTTPLLSNQQRGRININITDSSLSDSGVNLFANRSHSSQSGRVALPMESDKKPEESCCWKCIIL